MIEQMKVGVTLKLAGDAHQKVKAFHANIQKLTESIEVLEQKLKTVGRAIELFGGNLSKLSPLLKQFYRETQTAQISLKSLNTSATSGEKSFNRLSRGLAWTTTRMQNAAMQAATLRSELESLDSVANTGMRRGARTGGGGGGGGGGRRNGIHVHPLSFAGMGFSGNAMAAGGAAYLGYKSFKYDMDYQRSIQELALQNLPGGTAEAADKFVMSQRLYGVSPTSMARALTDSAVITRDFKHAEAIAPTLAKMRFASESIFPGKFSDEQEQAAIKVAEMVTGSQNPAKLADALEHMFKVGTSSGWRVMPTHFLAMVRAARGNLSGSEDAKNDMMSKIDPDFLFYTLESLVQEQGGPSVGRQLGQFFNHIRAGRLTTASAKDFEAMGLVKPGQAEYNNIGMIKRIIPGGIIGSEMGNAFDWINQVYLPHLKAHGVTTMSDIKKHILVDFTATDASLVTMMVAQSQKIQAAIAANKRAAGIDEAGKVAQGMSSGKAKELGAAWEKFEKSLGNLTRGPGQNLMDSLVHILNTFTTVFNFLDKIMTYVESKASSLPNPSTWLSGVFSSAVSAVGDAMNPYNSASAPSGGVINLQIREQTFATIMGDELDKLLNRHQYGTSSYVPYQNPPPPGTSAPFSMH